mmetsp:Transcript_37721/g.99724  ORF Transcript_37721/g.99724 Transcript_37721/m.99724 type:complete len:143 (-) Transcript_37721:415-843(-)|eukprot:CAMPEP_0115855904 /NCGR_PEP_ID=MMETSP0287-20121206/14780_1 /TAXON_ID=412157 /ORGANISM="Chrysochromulina rotalis, Strain UIO044" /LENGTH=142 /DNA_ID=CAMNT_0003310067 /DNA_START=95 /DNA_END=523 /DNA_ORIENTATION=+
MGCGASTQGAPSRSQAAPPLPREQVNQTVRTDAAGKVVAHDSYEDWKRKTAAKKLATALSTEAGRVELKALYTSLDIDGDGRLTADEWSSGLAANEHLIKKYFGGCTIEETAETFNRIDSDDNGSLSWEEFLDGAVKSIKLD